MSADAAAIDAALAGGAAADKPLVHAATAANWQAMAEVAKKHGCPLVIRSRGRRPRGARRRSPSRCAAPASRTSCSTRAPGRSAGDLAAFTQLRRLALKKGARALGYPDRRRRHGADVAGRAGARHAGGRQVRRRHRPRPLRAGGALLAAHAAPEHLHRPAEADPDGAQALRDRRRRPRTARCSSRPTSRSPTSRWRARSRAPASPRGCWSPTATASRCSPAGRPASSTPRRSPRRSRISGIEQKVSHKKLVIPGHVAGLSGEVEEELPELEDHGRAARRRRTSPTTSRTSGVTA